MLSSPSVFKKEPGILSFRHGFGFINSIKHKTMRILILAGCLTILNIAGAQSNGRVAAGNTLRWGMKNGSVETLEGELKRTYSTDTLANKRIQIRSASFENSRTTKLTSLRTLCDHNSIAFNWTAWQQPGADRYELEQSADQGITWQPIGTVPAVKTELKEESYHFRYNKNLEQVLFRVTAVHNTGERINGATVESPCSNNQYRAIVPNPVYSIANIQLGAPQAAKVELQLVNSNGVVVQTREQGLMAGINQVAVDMSSLNKGIYTLFVQWQGGRQDAYKLVRQ